MFWERRWRKFGETRERHEGDGRKARIYSHPSSATLYGGWLILPSKLRLLPKDIEERLKGLSGKVASVRGLIALWLFGSFARGEATPVSDVDLAYLPDENLRGDALEKFETELYLLIADTLGTDEFAFVNLREAPAFFAWHILAEGKLLFCRESR